MKNQYRPYVYKRADSLGLKVIDSKTPLHVAVTDDDVVKAKQANSKHCALARASMRLPGVLAAYFFRSLAFLEYEDKMLKFSLPHSVQKEIVSFDRAQIFASGVYKLSPVPPANRMNQMKHRNKAERKRRLQAARSAKAEVARKAKLAEQIEKIKRSYPADPDTAEQRVFEARIKAVTERYTGNRTVTGIQKPEAPQPLQPRRGYVHRTQYIRDLREPQE